MQKDSVVVEFPTRKIPPIMCSTPTEALAEAWASIDGKMDQFREERRPGSRDTTGTYVGYMLEADEAIERLKMRGYDIVPIIRFPM